MGAIVYKLPTTKEWYRQIDILEGGREVSAGVGDPVLDKVSIARDSSDAGNANILLRRAFSRLARGLRLDRKLSYEELARRADVDPEQLRSVEEDPCFQTPPRTLVQLAEFYELPPKRFLILAGAIREQAVDLEREAVQFAAQSASFEVLSGEQKRLLHDFVRQLKENGD